MRQVPFFVVIASSVFAVAVSAETKSCLGNAGSATCNSAATVTPGSIAPFRKPGQPYAVGLPRRKPPRGHAQLLTKSFHVVGSGIGEWSGSVTGEGDVALVLELRNGTNLLDRRSIGSLELAAGDAIPFRFRSSLPHANDWQWDIRFE